MRRRFVLYVHEKATDSSGMDLLIQRITDHHIIEVVIDINAYKESKSEIEDALQEYIPDVIIKVIQQKHPEYDDINVMSFKRT